MKTLIIGIDSFDPAIFEEMAGKNQLPNLEKLSGHGGYSKLEVSSPPQTEVSWTCIATGVDPGGHGIFDFVHRDPATYIPYVSILPMRKSAVGEQFVPPYTTKTFFEEAAALGYSATALWWPAMFPARPALPVNTLPGLGTPDIRGQLGVGTLLTSEDENLKKTTVVKLSSAGKDCFTALLAGPQTPGREGPRTISLPIRLDIIDQKSAKLTIDSRQLNLYLGEWSDIVELRFKAGMLFNVYAITRFIATRLDHVVRVYALPLQIHPLHSLWHYASSTSLSKKLWKDVGPYLTLGWPQDTTGLEEGCIDDDQFLMLCQSIFNRRIQILRYLILSDHGFSDFRKKVHLNRWLLDNSYLFTKNGGDDLSGVDWSKTVAYAVGLNSIYLNIAGREGQGIVSPYQLENLINEIKNKLLDWKDADQTPIIQKIRFKHETFSGPYTRFGPDLVMGYAPGYRASAETGLGKVPAISLEPNTDHWGADHCVDSDVVPGVIFANRDLRDFGTISFRDIPFLAIGKHLDPSNIKPPSQATGQGQKDLEERLKGLGYL